MKLLTGMHRSGAIAVSLVFLLLAGCGGGGDGAPSGSVSGTVTSMDTNQPVAGLSLELVDKDFTPYTGDDPASYAANQAAIVATAVTADDGSYSMPHVPAGDYYLGAAPPSSQSVISSSGENPVVVSVGEDAVTADVLSGTPVQSSQDGGTYYVDVTFANLPESKDGKYDVDVYRRNWLFFIPGFCDVWDSNASFGAYFSDLITSIGNAGFEAWSDGCSYFVLKDAALPFPTISFSAPAEKASNSLYFNGMDNTYYVKVTYTTPSGKKKTLSSHLFSVALHSPPAHTSFTYDCSANKIVESFPTDFGGDQKFIYSSGFGATGVFALNGDHTWNATIDGADYSGTWSLDASGRLLCVTTTGGNYTDTYTVTSFTDTTITASFTETHPDIPGYQLTDTATFTRIFNASMFAGRSFSYTGSNTGSQGVISFNNDGTWTQTGDTPTSGTWSIDNQGRLVSVSSETGTTTTYSLTQNAWNTIQASAAQGDSATETVTLSEVFSTSLLAGKTFSYSGTKKNSTAPFGDKQTITFENDGTWHTVSGLSGNWSVNTAGTLHVADSEIEFSSYLALQQGNSIKAECKIFLNEQHTAWQYGLQDFILVPSL